MFKLISFGRLLRKSTSFYTRGVFNEAALTLDKAMEINSGDFTANLLRLRLAVRLEELDQAQISILECKKINQKAADLLITPWEEALNDIRMGKPLESSRLAELDMKTEYELKKLQDDRDISLLDPIIIMVFLFLIWRLLGVIIDPSLNEMRKDILHIIDAFLLTIYYNYKASMNVNLFIRLCQFIENAWRSFWSFHFFAIIALIVLLKLKYPNTNIVELTGMVSYFKIADVFAGPVATQLFYCGFVFRSLTKYNMSAAYIITATCLGWGTDRFVGAFIISVIYSYFFNKYNTIAAPIVLAFIIKCLDY